MEMKRGLCCVYLSTKGIESGFLGRRIENSLSRCQSQRKSAATNDAAPSAGRSILPAGNCSRNANGTHHFRILMVIRRRANNFFVNGSRADADRAAGRLVHFRWSRKSLIEKQHYQLFTSRHVKSLHVTSSHVTSRQVMSQTEGESNRYDVNPIGPVKLID